MGFAARVSCVSVRQLVDLFSLCWAAAGIHRPAPMMIVVTPSFFVVELAYGARRGRQMQFSGGVVLRIWEPLTRSVDSMDNVLGGHCGQAQRAKSKRACSRLYRPRAPNSKRFSLWGFTDC